MRIYFIFLEFPQNYREKATGCQAEYNIPLIDHLPGLK